MMLRTDPAHTVVKLGSEGHREGRTGGSREIVQTDHSRPALNDSPRSHHSPNSRIQREGDTIYWQWSLIRLRRGPHPSDLVDKSISLRSEGS